MKKYSFIIIFFPLLAIAAVLFYYFAAPDTNRLNLVHIYLTDNIYEKWTDYIKSRPPEKKAITDFDSLKAELTFYERIFIDKLFEIDPADIGFKGPFFSLDKPANLVETGPTELPGKKGHILPKKYCPRHSFEDYEIMMQAMEKDLGRRLYINSGYRSPGRQAYGFIDDLVMERNDYSMKKAARWVAMPGYSEHNSGLNNAIDFINRDGISGEEKGQRAEDFEALPEYKWLSENAHKYNFYLTYPRNNIYGVQFESWHWHWERQPSFNPED